ncbi:flagellar hook-length control protein FliK [Pseudobacteroides cellulosolvens]|uniref:Flagellar hook-length control protein-like protein n=1 Tax=Pseudobacteroides cellulosolvens ATCC 35603 = DSM 2933 TaxID=398512 RepID=A0A0L6JRH0_9FIRM|nr:flagellar hook-length control protein FliK [Pseudobacteroides cellulosolvens]KNY28378.1 Flagellar hook-length control protein-like protein [Pseudobacteroides cellulosolvens ATCC 35603 = DSM 2933]
MITQDLMMGFLSRAQAFSTAAKSGIGTEKASSAVLKAPYEKEASFNTQLKAAENRRNSNRADSKEPIGKDKARINSYREAIRTSQNTGTKDTKESTKAVDDTDRKARRNEEDNNVKKPVGKGISQEELAIAQVLGIQPEVFRDIMANLGIETQDFQNEDNVSSIVESISQKLGLSGDQMNALKDLITGVMELMDTKAGQAGYVVLSETKGIDEVNIQESKGKMETSPEVSSHKGELQKSPLDGLVEKLKEKIQELTQKVQENPEEMKKELAKIVEGMLEKYGRKAAADDIIKDNSATSTQEETSLVIKGDTEKSMQSSDNESESSKSKEPKSNTTEENLKASDENTETKTQEHVYLKSSKEDLGLESKADIKSISSDLNAAGIKEQGTLNKTAGEVDVYKSLKEQPVSKREILTQIIDKAKVVFNGDKSEMVLSMRPESLGKLSMKIVTENGIITAKFVAESQQVKEVLESNMQLLKDTLEKQGFSIQGFSVSVDSNPSREFNGHRENGNEVKTNNSKVGVNGHNPIASMEAAANIEKVNPYIMGENRINLTA